jgi:hypothetical protein
VVASRQLFSTLLFPQLSFRGFVNSVGHRGRDEAKGKHQMSEVMWKKDDGIDLQAGAAWEMDTEGIAKFTGSARSFMEHVQLLT